MSLRIAYTSDLHRGFSNNTDRIQDKYFSRWVLENGQPDVLILAGDLASHDPKHQIPGLFKMLRRHFTCPILAVRGNHDFWARGRKHHTLKAFDAYFTQACNAWEVVNLEDSPYYLGTLPIYGWLSWWGRGEPDGDRQSRQRSFLEMKQKEHETFLRVRLDAPPGSLLVTHMPPFGSWGADHAFSTRIDDMGPLAVIFGHTHKEFDRKVEETHYLNAGPDYDRPSLGLLELDGRPTHDRTRLGLLELDNDKD